LNLPPPCFLGFFSKALCPVPECLSNGCGSAGTPLVFLVSLAFTCDSFSFTLAPVFDLGWPYLPESSAFFFSLLSPFAYFPYYDDGYDF